MWKHENSKPKLFDLIRLKYAAISRLSSKMHFILMATAHIFTARWIFVFIFILKFFCEMNGFSNIKVFNETKTMENYERIQLV